jgi:hypothetical protein
MKKKVTASPWSDSNVEFIKASWKSGESAGRISQLLRERGVIVSRNAVISKLHRIGLLGPQTSAAKSHSLTNAPRRGSVITRPASRENNIRVQLPTSKATKVERKQRRDADHVHFDFVRSSVPHAGVHHPLTEHLSLLQLSEREDVARERGDKDWRRCRWPTSPFTAREATYCAVLLSRDMAGQYCPVHAYRMSQTGVSEGLREQLSVIFKSQEVSEPS